MDATVRSAARAVIEVIRKGSPDPDTLPDSGYEPAFLDETAPLLEFLYAKYFRVRMLGMENVPAAGPALVVANHSGGLPYDGAMLIYAFWRERHRPLRTLIANFAFRSSWMRP